MNSFFNFVLFIIRSPQNGFAEMQTNCTHCHNSQNHSLPYVSPGYWLTIEHEQSHNRGGYHTQYLTSEQKGSCGYSLANRECSLAGEICHGC